MENKPQRIEIADIFGSRAQQFLKSHELCPEQKKAFEAITQCRTAALGGHLDRCDSCGYSRPAYNSCRNRNCPRCQSTRKIQWVDKLTANLPPVRHFHVVFTIPECLNPLFLLNQQKAYSLFFKAAAKALVQCGSNPAFLGAQVGAVAILHTWGQTLAYHPHIHMIVPAGGLSDDQMEWVPAKKNFFVPVKALSATFRGILIRLIKEKILCSELQMPGQSPDFEPLKTKCYSRNWVVYCEKPFANTDKLVHYLGNYTHRVAISSHRILEYANERVTFSYKDYKEAGIRKKITLDADEFIRRFMLHVLPQGFYKIRYIGFMAICNMKDKLTQCFGLIGKTAFLPVLEGLTALEVWRSITGHDPLLCPKCFCGTMKPVQLATKVMPKSG